MSSVTKQCVISEKCCLKCNETGKNPLINVGWHHHTLKEKWKDDEKKRKVTLD